MNHTAREITRVRAQVRPASIAATTSDGERVLDRNNLDSTRTLWIRDLSGKVLREYGRTGGGVWGWSKDYVYREGLPVATVTAAATRHLHLDHLGTVRRMTDTQATPQLLTAASRNYYPFGLEATTTADPERLRFTGHQRDTQGTAGQADDLDYMHARYYNPTVGRFLSLDPVRGNSRTPQSWNLYAYVQNNPVNATDPDGKLLLPQLIFLGPPAIKAATATAVVVVGAPVVVAGYGAGSGIYLVLSATPPSAAAVARTHAANCHLAPIFFAKGGRQNRPPRSAQDRAQADRAGREQDRKTLNEQPKRPRLEGEGRTPRNPSVDDLPPDAPSARTPVGQSAGGQNTPTEPHSPTDPGFPEFNPTAAPGFFFLPSHSSLD